jgi:hypothetical protein
LATKLPFVPAALVVAVAITVQRDVVALIATSVHGDP